MKAICANLTIKKPLYKNIEFFFKKNSDGTLTNVAYREMTQYRDLTQSQIAQFTTMSKRNNTPRRQIFYY